MDSTSSNGRQPARRSDACDLAYHGPNAAQTQLVAKRGKEGCRREGSRMYKIIDGVRLAYDVAGSGDAIVLLHGFALDRSIWDAQFRALAARWRVVRLDLRGS